MEREKQPLLTSALSSFFFFFLTLSLSLLLCICLYLSISLSSTLPSSFHPLQLQLEKRRSAVSRALSLTAMPLISFSPSFSHPLSLSLSLFSLFLMRWRVAYLSALPGSPLQRQLSDELIHDLKRLHLEKRGRGQSKGDCKEREGRTSE